MRDPAIVSAFLLSVAGLSACASPSGPIREVHLAANVDWTLVEPLDLGREIAAAQRFEGSWQGSDFAFDAQVEIDSERVVIVALTPFGSRGFTLVYRKGYLDYAPGPWLECPVPPRELLAVFLFAVAPLDAVARGLSAGGDQLAVRDGDDESRDAAGDGRFRELVRAGTPVVRVSYEHRDPWTGAVAYERLESGDRLEIATWLVEPLAPEEIEASAGAGFD